MRRRNNNKSRRILATVLGIFFVLVCVEMGLRLVGRVHVGRALNDARNRDGAGADAFIVLCVGDSFTYGSGATENQDYPARLERLLQKKYPDRKIIVVNRGIGCANTQVVLDSLESNLRLVEPDVVVALAGVANLWNFYGLDSFVRGRETIRGKLRNLLYRLRLFKLGKLLYLDLVNKSRTKTESSFYPVSPLDADDNQYHVHSKEKQNFEQTSPEYYAQKGLEEYYSGRTEKAIAWFLRAIQEHPRDPESYTWLNECLVRVGRKKEAITRLKTALGKVKPPLPVLYSELSRAYFEDGQFMLSAQTALDGAAQFPLFRGIFDAFINAFKRIEDENLKIKLLSVLKNLSASQDGKLAREFLLYARRIKDNVIEDIVPLWIETGLKEIVLACKRNNVPVLLLTYPHDKHLSPVIFRAAKATRTDVVDFYELFSRITGPERSSYFSADGHCNAKGYNFMAEELVRKIKQVSDVE